MQRDVTAAFIVRLNATIGARYSLRGASATR